MVAWLIDDTALATPVGFPPGKLQRLKVDGGLLSQGGTPLARDEHGYDAIALDTNSLTLAL